MPTNGTGHCTISFVLCQSHQAGTLKKLLEYHASSHSISKTEVSLAIKELVTDTNFECDEEGIMLQAITPMSHLCPSNSKRRHSSNTDRPIPLGVNLTCLIKVLKCAKDDNICILKAADEADLFNLVYEAKSKVYLCSNNHR